MQCGTCIVEEYAGENSAFTYTLLIPLIDRALAKRAEWMREQAAKVLESIGDLPANNDRRIGSNLAVKNGAKLIRALPLAPRDDQ